MAQAVVARRRAAIPWEHARSALSRTALGCLVLGAALLSPPSPREDVGGGLADLTNGVRFSIVGWEVGALAEKAGAAVASQQPADPVGDVAAVRAHFDNVAELRRLRAQRDDLFARDARAELPGVEAKIDARAASFASTRRATEGTIAGQIDAVMRSAGLRSSLFSRGAGEWPLPFLRIEPEVFFSYQPLPLNLLVAPRDRIAIVGSVLVSPDMDADQIDALESRMDALGVSSLVGPIGGLGSYPSMVPDTLTLRQGLDTVAHEWTHHYLALRPLGRAYFSSYDMRTVNETVADMVGQEIGRATWERYYAAGEPAAPVRAPPAAAEAPAAPRPDFGTEMRRIRAEVEKRLRGGDVEGAERYMAEQRDELARLGFHVRKLNTAYLSFFGAYSGGANRFEAPLRALRKSSPDLATFLHRVEQLSTPKEVLALR